MIYLIFILIFAAVVYHYFYGKAIYLITYTVDIEGKRIIDSCRYIIPVKHGLPSTNEIKEFTKNILVESTNLRIIDIHRLS